MRSGVWGSRTRRHVKGVVEVRPFPGARWPVALKAAAAVGVPLAAATATGRQDLGLLVPLGAFAVLYGVGAPARFRARLVAAAGAGLVGAAVLGAASAGNGLLSLAAVVEVGVVATWLCLALRVGPPGAFFMALTAGVSANTVAHGVAPRDLLAAITLGAISAWITSMIDVPFRPRAPEEKAVAAAETALAGYETADVDTEPEARIAASTALHAAWTSVTDGAGASPRGLSPRRRALVDRLWVLHERFTRHAALTTSRAVAVPVVDPWDDGRDEPAVDEPVLEPDLGPRGLREVALGRPGPRYLLFSSLTHPSESRLAVGRVALASTVAGSLALALGNGHVYWAASFACLVLHQGGTRLAQTYRGVQRILGTGVGLLIFAALHRLDLGGTWWLVLVVVALQFAIEMVIVRNYGLAVIGITPLAMTMADVGTGGTHTWVVVTDRILDTAIAVTTALVVLWATGRTRAVPILRGQARRCLLALRAVMADLAADPTHHDGLDSAAALEHRRHLYFELLELHAVAARTHADEPDRVAPYEEMWRAVSDLGFLVLGACWHPHLRDAPALFADARRALDPILATPVTAHRDADAIHADVLAVREVVTAWDARTQE